MAFDKSKDKVIESWELDNGNDKKLVVSVMSYNGGEPKLQIGPRTYIKRNGGTGYGKSGRLTMTEVNFVSGIINQLTNINLLTE